MCALMELTQLNFGPKLLKLLVIDTLTRTFWQDFLKSNSNLSVVVNVV